MNNVRFLLLGRFEVIVNDGTPCAAVSRSKKGCALLQHLILHKGKAVRFGDLYDALWSGGDSTDPESALKTLVSRTRSLLESCADGIGSCIISARGTYQWNESFPCFVDLFEFERLCADLKKQESLTEKIRSLFDQAVVLYRGDLLSDSAQESWMTPRSAQLHDMYIHMVRKYLELLKAEQNYDEVVRVCRTALTIDAFDEALNIALMDALVKTKRSSEALTQYKLASDLHVRHLGMELPEGIQDFYKQIIKSGQALDMDIGGLRDELREYGESSGAFVCEYAVFKDIYNLLLRRIERTSNTIFLALVMLSSPNGKPIDAPVLNGIMEQFLNILKGSLRKGDIITQYNASQYAMMLPMQTYESGRKVMERIKKSFYASDPVPSVVCSYRIDLLTDKPGSGAGAK